MTVDSIAIDMTEQRRSSSEDQAWDSLNDGMVPAIAESLRDGILADRESLVATFQDAMVAGVKQAMSDEFKALLATEIKQSLVDLRTVFAEALRSVAHDLEHGTERTLSDAWNASASRRSPITGAGTGINTSTSIFNARPTSTGLPEESVTVPETSRRSVSMTTPISSTSTILARPTSATPVVRTPHRPAPTYKMSRELESVFELWEEWENGLDGRPSIKYLEYNYGTQWRANSAEKQFFCRRKAIIDEVNRMAEANDSNIQYALQVTDAKRLGLKPNSLDNFGKVLLKERRERRLAADTAANR
ncbi:transcriptional activator of glycolytic enzymes-domain-containing protein [Lipomyces chichibuensis]|uniref:transcriptional activator of glycolytic enzymes-domain-containing protein n=1 Tax=Lipomyces chichibuensis TaxID=1546026 RepID=UPI0033443105